LDVGDFVPDFGRHRVPGRTALKLRWRCQRLLARLYVGSGTGVSSESWAIVSERPLVSSASVPALQDLRVQAQLQRRASLATAIKFGTKYPTQLGWWPNGVRTGVRAPGFARA